MKKILFLLLVAALSSCDVLDVKPESDIPAEDAFKDKRGIEKATLGAYASFQNLGYYGRNYLIFADLAADNLDHPIDATDAQYAQVDDNDILPENTSIDGMWTSAYEGINIANNVIVQVPLMTDMDSVEKVRALGELYFIRALNHFNLLNYFGGIPIKTTPTVGTGGINVPRASTEAVYAQIIEDLQYAEDHLEASAVKARASKFAAKALLARVYLYKGDNALASAKATEVIQGGGYDTIPYENVFVEGSKESIFEIDFTVLSRNRVAHYNFPTPDGRGEVQPSASIVAAYAANDTIRKKVSIQFADNKPYAFKYRDLSTGADNIIVLRLAEMYLIRAEAETREEGDIAAIQADINVIRRRARIEDTEAADYPALLLAIEQERRVEFAFEGHRWFDLVRTGRAVAVLPNVTEIEQTLFPIPLEEILTNRHPDMKQNKGY